MDGIGTPARGPGRGATMRTTVKFKVTGVEAVEKAFRDLPVNLARKVIRQAERKALKIPKAVISRTAPVKTGVGKKTLKILTSKGPAGSQKKNTIALALLIGRVKAKGWWMALQEFGWRTGKHIRSGKEVVGRVGKSRHVLGKHFVKKAMQETESQVKDVMTKEILEGIERAAKS